VRVVRPTAELRDALAEMRGGSAGEAEEPPVSRGQGKRIGLVPTMGSFHEGHLSLMRASRQECDVVVVSLFVNPTQFGPGEDLRTYPRDEQRDAELAEREGVDLLWIPETEQIYPEGFATTVEVASELTGVLEGDPAQRGPSHFRGVTTIVAKLFNSVQPDVAYFGRKDAQQALVIRRMAEDLDFPVEIRVLATVREEDGLAMSSRNAYLSGEEREHALAISRALRAAERLADEGETSTDALVEAARAELRRAGVEPEYLEARSAEDLSPIAELNGRPVLVAVAARVGVARLIDNVVIDPPLQNEPTEA
jgi:pantoate--beta-alanine ligase